MGECGIHAGEAMFYKEIDDLKAKLSTAKAALEKINGFCRDRRELHMGLAEIYRCSKEALADLG